MEYHGKLYGKIGKKYFDTTRTSDDWDAMEKRISELEAENSLLKETVGRFCYVCNKEIVDLQSMVYKDMKPCHYSCYFLSNV